MSEVKLVASVIVRNEGDRYLSPFLHHLLDVVDEIRILDDGSTDETSEILGEFVGTEPVFVLQNDLGVSMFEAEGKVRNRLLAWTYEADPTHVLAIDADEFLSRPDLVRSAVDANPEAGAYGIDVSEVWKTTDVGYQLREDGGWRHRSITPLWLVPPERLRRRWIIPQKNLASGRVPTQVNSVRQRVNTGSALLHFGWACEYDRQGRYDRYVAHDNGRFHQKKHLDSIMLPDDQITLGPIVAWDETTLGTDLVDEILARVRRGAPPPKERTTVAWNAETDHLLVGLFDPMPAVFSTETRQAGGSWLYDAEGKLIGVALPTFTEGLNVAAGMPIEAPGRSVQNE